MIEYSPVCRSTGEVCPAKVALIEAVYRKESLLFLLSSDSYSYQGKIAELRDMSRAGQDILNVDMPNCGSEKCLVIDSLVQVLFERSQVLQSADQG